MALAVRQSAAAEGCKDFVAVEAESSERAAAEDNTPAAEVDKVLVEGNPVQVVHREILAG